MARNNLSIIRVAVAVIACATAAAVALGVNTVTTWLSLFAMVVAALVAATSSKRENPLARMTRTNLQRASFVGVIITLLWGLTIILAGYAAITHALRQTGKIEGVVVLADGGPGAGALVQIDGRPAATTGTDGRFTIPFTRWRIGKARSAQVTAQRGAASGSEFIALTADIAHVRLVLPPEHAAYRVIYVRAARRSVDFVLDPPRREDWDAALGGRRFDIRNNIYEELRALSERFSQDGGMSVYYVRGREDDSALAERLARDPPQRRSFAGSSGVNMGNYFSLSLRVPAATSDIASLSDPQAQWLSYWKESPDPRPETKLQFRRPLQRTDFGRSNEPLARFWDYVTRDYLPEDFGTANLSLESEACGDDQGWYPHMTLVGRLLVVDLAVIENTASYPLNIGGFVGRKIVDKSLRAQDADDRHLRAAATTRDHAFTIDVLRPGEKIAIPLRMLLVHPRDQYDDHLVQLALARDIASLGIFNFGGQWIDVTTLAQRVYTAPDRKDNAIPYVYGPSYALDAIEIGGVEYAVRKQPARLLIVDSANEIGSCPFFYGWSQKDAKWVSGGTILYGRRAPALYGTDERPLHNFDGRVRVAELEPETSFIDRLYVVAIDAAGKRTILMPKDNRLQLADGVNVRMNLGDEIIVEFARPPETARSFVFGATGYYVPGGVSDHANP